MQLPYLFNIRKQGVSYYLEICSKLFLNCKAMICFLLRSNLTPIPVYYHNTNSILMLGDVLQSIYNLPRIDLYLVDHQCNPHPCSISQNKLYFTDWKCIPIDFKFAKHLFPLFEYQCNPRTCSIP